MSPIFWPISEVVGDKVDRARERLKALTSNVEGTLREPLVMAAARRRMAEQFDPILGGLRESLNPVQAAGTIGRSVIPAADEATKPLMEQARSRFEELTKPVMDQFGAGFQSGETERRAATAEGRRELPYKEGRTPGELAGQMTSSITGPLRDVGEPFARRMGANYSGAADVTRPLLGETGSRLAGAAAAGLSAAPSAAGAALEYGAERLGASQGVARGIGNVAEAISPSGLAGDTFGALTKGRLALAGAGAAAGAGIGAALAPEDSSPVERGLSALTGAGAGTQIGSALPDIVGAAGRLTQGARSLARNAPRSADLLGAPLGAAAGAATGPDDQSTGDRLKRAAVGAVFGPGIIRSARGLVDMGRVLDNLSILRAVDDGADASSLRSAEDLTNSIEGKLERYNQIGNEIGELQNRRSAMEELASGTLVHPPTSKGSVFAGRRWSEADLYEIAERMGVNPHRQDWWEQIDPETVRLYRQEASVRRGPRPPTPKQQAASMRRMERELTREQRALEQQLTQHYEQLDAQAPEATADAAPSPVARTEQEAGQAPLPQDPAERVRQSTDEITAIRAHPDMTPQAKRAAIKAVFDRNADLSPDDRALLRAGVPRRRVTPGELSPVPPARPPEPGRVEYPPAAALNPQSPVPTEPGGVPIPPGTREMGEGNLPTGRESQGQMADVRQGAIPPIRAEPGAIPPAPEPEGVGIMAPGRPPGSPQIGMEGMPPTREGTVNSERLPSHADPIREGIDVTWTDEAGAARTGRVIEPDPTDPELFRVLPMDRAEGPTTVLRRDMTPADTGLAGTPMGPPEPPLPPVVNQLPDGPSPRPPGIPIMRRATISGTPTTDYPQIPTTDRVFPERFPGMPDPQPVAPDLPLKLSKQGQVRREEMVAASVRGGADQADAEALADAAIRMMRTGKAPPKEFVEPSRWRTLGEGLHKWNQARYSLGILSSPVGGVRDALFTAVNLPLTNARIAAASAVERAANVPARERTATFSMLRGFDEGKAAGASQASQEFLQILRSGKIGDELAVSADLPQPLVTHPVAGPVLEFGYRLRLASDRFYTTMGNRMASMGLAYREAERAGLTSGTPEYARYVEQTGRRIQATMDSLAKEAAGEGRRVPQGPAVPRAPEPALPAGMKRTAPAEANYDALAKEAFQISRRLVYQQEPGALTSAFGKTRAVSALSTVVPLYRTIATMAATGISYHPAIGTAGALVDAARGMAGEGALLSGPYARSATSGGFLTRTNTASVLPLSQRLADSVLVGGSVAALGAVMMSQGLITGTGPSDASVRRRMMDEGWRPLALHFGDTYIPLGQALGPLGMPFGMGATIQESRDKGIALGEEDTNALWKMTQVLMDSQQSQWFQQSGLRDFYEVMNAIGSPDPDERDRAQKRLLSGAVNQWIVPMSGATRLAANISDGTVRDPRGLVERYLVNFPGLSQMVPARTTETGQPVERSGVERLGQLSPVIPVAAAPGARRYRGSESAEMDAEITRAIAAYQNYRRAPDQYRPPTARQQQFYYLYRSAQDPRAAAARTEESAARRRRSVLEPTGPIASLVGSRGGGGRFVMPGS